MTNTGNASSLPQGYADTIPRAQAIRLVSSACFAYQRQYRIDCNSRGSIRLPQKYKLGSCHLLVRGARRFQSFCQPSDIERTCSGMSIPGRCAGRAAPYQLHTRLVVAAQWSRSAPCGRINIAEGPRLFTPTAACRSVIRSFWLYLITLWARGFSHNF